MAGRIKTDDAHHALKQILRERANDAAGGNHLISKTEAKDLDPFLKAAEEDVRAEQGPYARVTVDEAVERAAQKAKAAWDQFSPPGTLDGLYLSKAELAQVEDQDPALGELSRLAYLRAGQPPPDPAGAAKAFFESVDFSTLRTSLPGGVQVDPSALPFKAKVAFDHYARAMDADWATVTAHAATIDGHDVHVVYTTTDGDDAYLEVFGPDEQGLISTRLDAGEIVDGWDTFFARGRLSFPILNLSDARWTDGYSEPDEAAAAGQLPIDGSWTAGVVLDRGTIVREGDHRFIGLDGAPHMTDEQTRVAYLALEFLQEQHLKNMDWDLELGSAGTLRVGHFTRPDDGELYLVADWEDVDDSSFTLYFEPSDAGPLLKIKQYNG